VGDFVPVAGGSVQVSPGFASTEFVFLGPFGPGVVISRLYGTVVLNGTAANLAQILVSPVLSPSASAAASSHGSGQALVIRATAFVNGRGAFTWSANGIAAFPFVLPIGVAIQSGSMGLIVAVQNASAAADVALTMGVEVLGRRAVGVVGRGAEP
jgi:hypothetical protein